MTEKKIFSRREFLKAAAAASALVPLSTIPAFAAPQPVQATTELVIWYWADYNREIIAASPDNPEAQWWGWIFDHFEESNPNAHLRVEAHGWDKALHDGLLAAIAGGNAPDVTHGEAFVQEFAALGAFDSVSVNPDDFPSGAIAGAIRDDVVYGVPAMTSSFALEVNQTVLEQSGGDPNFTPETWDELVRDSASVFKAGGEGQNWFGFTVYGPGSSYRSALRVLPWINRAGASMGDGKQAMFNDPRSIPAYEMLRSLFKTSDMGAALSDDDEMIGSVVWGNRAAYQISASWDAWQAHRHNANTVFAPIPAYPGDGATAANTVVGNIVFSPLKTSVNAELAVRLVEFLAEPESQWQIAKIRGFFLPALKSVLADPNVTRQKPYEGFEANLQVIVDTLLDEQTYPVPPFPKNGMSIWENWNNVYGQILLTEEPIPELLDKLQADTERLLT
jgi:ABC-type glycerol-3-phosphate transport system substrate-binding protein